MIGHMKKTKVNHGGKRKGAGRHPLPESEKQITRSFSIHPLKSKALNKLKSDEKTLGNFLVEKLRL